MPVPGEVTDLSRIETSTASFSSGGATIAAYVARPAGGTDLPGVIVIHEAFGPVEHISDLARRFANAGFLAVAPNLYSRVGTPDPKDMQSVFQKMFLVTDADTVADLEATAAFLRAQPGANGKVGCIGFCSGGRQTLLFASSSGAVDAAVDCWGGFIMRATQDAATTPSRPTPVVDLARNAHCPVYAVFGGDDQNPSPADAEVLRTRLAESGQPCKVKVFPNAGHAFLADYRPSYQEKAAFELWPEVVAFFETHLR